MIHLYGIAWDHPRGYEPLRAVSEEYSKLHPDVRVNWDVRSLREFGDMPIETLIDRYDLITIDHPYMGQAHENGLLLPLNQYFADDILNELAGQSVGPAFQSYLFHGQLYALSIDAAALVAAYRYDLLEEFSLTVPRTRDELKRFYSKIPNGFWVAWPLCATDLWCSFLTLCAQDGGSGFIMEFEMDEQVGSKVLDELKVHLEFLHPQSIHWNPIAVLDKMANEDSIIYSPYLFGYTNYAREGFSKNRLNFINSPVNPLRDVSTILGGVGLAVSARSRNVSTAVDFVYYAACAQIQEGIYTRTGGQPGNIIAWQSENNNRLCNNFFKDTLETFESAYMRPRHPGWNRFQEQGAELLHQGLQKNRPSQGLMKELNELYQSLLN